MRLNIDNLDGIETFTPSLTPQEQVDAAHRAYLEARVRRLESVCLAAQLYCGHGDARTAEAILAQALTGI